MNKEKEYDKLIEMRLDILNNISDDSKDKIFRIYLKRAKNIAIRHMYPYEYNKEHDLPEQLDGWQIECAEELYKRRNTKWLKSYSENGLSESYGSTEISQELLSQLPPPKVGVPE